MPDIVISLNGEEHTVSSESVKLPKGFILVEEGSVMTHEEHATLQEAAIQKRFKNWVKKTDAVNDEDVRRAILSEQPPAPDLENAEKQWSERKLNPVLEELTDIKKTLVSQSIVDASKEFFTDVFTTSVIPGKPSLAELTYDGAAAWDPDHKYVVAVDDKGNPVPASKPTKARPYMTPREFIETDAKANAALQTFLREAETNSGGPGHNSRGGAPAPATTKAELLKDRKAKEAFIEQYGWDRYKALPET